MAGRHLRPAAVLIRIALWWSVFIALTAIVGLKVGGTMLGGLGLLVVIQFLFGAGEAGGFPNITRALHNWFPTEQRGFAQGAVWMCGRMMGGLTPLIWMFLMGGLRHIVPEPASEAAAPLLSPWRIAFLLAGLVGVVWCLSFARWFHDRPEQNPGVNAAELAWIRSGGPPPTARHAGVPWLRILTSGNLWLLCVMYACQSYGWYFYITYLPQFCEAIEQHADTQSSPIVAALFKGGPLWMGAIGCLVGGFLTDWFIRRSGNRRLGRRVFGAIGARPDSHRLPDLLRYLLGGRGLSSIFLIIMAAGFCTDLTMGSAWALCQDIGKRYSAIVAGLMNMIGNLGGTMANLVSGYVLARAAGVPRGGSGGRCASPLGSREESRPDARLPDYLPHCGRHVRDRLLLLAAHRRHSAGRPGMKNDSCCRGSSSPKRLTTKANPYSMPRPMSHSNRGGNGIGPGGRSARLRRPCDCRRQRALRRAAL